MQWIPPHERARAVSLATSGMYLGSAGAMAALPGLAAAWGAAALLRVVAALGFAWLALWTVVGRDVPYRQPPVQPGAPSLAPETGYECISWRQNLGSSRARKTTERAHCLL